MFDPNVQRLARKLYAQLDSPRALTCFLLLQSGTKEDLGQLVNLRVDPRSYEPYLKSGHSGFRLPIDDGVEKLRSDVQATEFLRKYPGFDAGIDRNAVTLEGFFLCEEQCRKTNLRINHHLEYPVLTTKLQWAADKRLRRARAWLHNVLGKIPDRLDGRFGPGATFESPRWGPRKLVAYDKLHFSPCVTASASWLVDHLVWETAMQHSWADAVPNRLFPIAPGNRFTMVPKDATKNRGICIEAGANLFGQLAVGEHLKRCLKRVGIDLAEDISKRPNWSFPVRCTGEWFIKSFRMLAGGQTLHRIMAEIASMSGSHATIDLSNASDTIAALLVKFLLPEEWWELLDSLRSQHTVLSIPRSGKEGSVERCVKLEKFSSMGNGFTFELETLLFCALLHAVGCKIGTDTFVFGDDMIVPSSIAPEAIAFLQYCGFTPNSRKTFTDGYFRESCGGDYFNGADVRPYYLEEEPTNAADWIGVANGLWAVATKWKRPSLLAARNNALDNVPADIRRCRGPEALGDLVVHDLEEKWNYTTRSSVRYFRVWRPVQMKKELFYRRRVRDARYGPPRPGAYIYVTGKRSKRYSAGVPLTAALMGLPSDGLVPRDCVDGFRFGRVAWS